MLFVLSSNPKTIPDTGKAPSMCLKWINEQMMELTKVTVSGGESDM